jgi:hypothetical protein
MSRELIRQGTGPLVAYAAKAQAQARAEQQLAAIIVNTDIDKPASTGIQVYGLGDAAQLRGIPAVGVKGGHGGAIRGTRPGDTQR